MPENIDYYGILVYNSTVNICLRKWDTALLIFGILIFFGAIFWASAVEDGELIVKIEASEKTYLMPLSGEGHIDVKGPIGITRVNVSDGKAYISYSDSKNKIGMKMGKISTASGWLACLPNRVFVRLIPQNGQFIPDIDASTF